MNSEVIEKLDKLVEKELKAIVDKGDITPTEVDNAIKAVCLLHKVKHYEMDEEIEDEYEDMYSQRPYYRDYGMNSYERGRSPMTGRYVSRDRSGNNSNYWFRSSRNNYSQHGNDEMIRNLEMMRDQAKSEQERRMIDQWIDNAMTV